MHAAQGVPTLRWGAPTGALRWARMRAARSPSAALAARTVLALATAAALCALAGCGKGAGAQSPAVVAREAGLVSHETVAGAVGVVTKNTTRLGGADAASDAAAVAGAVFSALHPAAQPRPGV